MTAVARESAANGVSKCETFTFAWTADGSGNATGEIPFFAGYVEGVESYGSAAHSVVLDTSGGVDVLGGNGVTIAAAGEFRKPRVNNAVDGIGSLQAVFSKGAHTLAISGAGAGGTGTTILYVLRL